MPKISMIKGGAMQFFYNILLKYMACISIYFVSRYALQKFTGHMFEGAFPGWGWVYLLNVIFYLLTISCGLLVGVIMRSKILLHSSIVTALGVMLCNFLTKSTITNYALFISGITMGAFFGAIGGCMALLLKRFIDKAGKIIH